ncbi:hypothetical protein MMC30_009335 [Neofusicoccum parvum]|uniref:Uncharacterized protein n=1 Tax=Neofusicoccum parvum TaxID=310453 RepID=A0ACB5SQ02_9PEZI|nr:hypothetical protein MMC30_009335 [Neofusicoccum parvum]
MTILLFTDQFSEDRFSLLELQRSKHEFTIVPAFLNKVHAALREEIGLLPKAAQPQIPSFNSVVDLSERLRKQEVRSLEVESALVCINQLAAFISTVEGSPEGCSSTNGIVVGYGLGQLSAAAVACSDNVLELVTVATEAVRLAFRVGAVVRKCSAPLQSFRTSDLPWTAVIDEDLHQVTERLQTLQNELHDCIQRL